MQKLAVGKILQGLRKAKGITQEQLSEILGVSCAAISKWENEQMYPDISFFSYSCTILQCFNRLLIWIFK